MTQFRKGQKVVCIDDSRHNQFGMAEIVRGRVYTVRGVSPPDELVSWHFGRPLDEEGLLLEEVRRPIDDPEMGEMPFGSFRFRPVDETPKATLRDAEETA